MNSAVNQRVEQELFQCRVVAAALTAPTDFTIEVCGAITGTGRVAEATVSVTLVDVTEGLDRRLQVYPSARWSPAGDDSKFVYQNPLGTVEAGGNFVSHWTPVAPLKPEWLLLPRRGPRSLELDLRIQAADGQCQLARAHCLWEVDASEEGYLDAADKAALVRLWALPLVFALAGVSRRPSRVQVHCVRAWILPDVSWSALPWWTRFQFQWALYAMSRAARQVQQGRLQRLCGNITRIASMAQRYPILQLCLALCAVHRHVPREETELLWRISAWLELDPQRVRSLIEKALPVHQYELSDAGSMLGLSATLSQEDALRQLNREYAKWNARVTHADQSVQRQAAQMLDVIAQERGRRLG